MNKNEYLQRVFESQITTLKHSIEYAEDEINDLKNEINQRELNLQGDKTLLQYAEEEMRKLR